MLKSWMALLGAALPGIAMAADDVTVLHAEPLFAYSVAARSAATEPLAKAAAATTTTTVSFNAFGRDFTLELEPNARLAQIEAELALPLGVGAFRGKLTDRPSSWARVVLTPGGPAGLVFDGSEMYALELRADTAAAANTTAVIFRLADVEVAPGALSCEIAEAGTGAQSFAAIVDELTPLSALGATLNLNIGAVADFEFYEAFGANAQQAILTRLNNVDGIFSEQVGIQITVAATNIFVNSADPFTSTSAGTLLSQLADYRASTPAQRRQGLTHLLTGRNLDGQTAGIAYVGSLCSTRFGAGLSESRRGAAVDSLIAAHEIGHNFGAPHDAEANSPCQSTDATWLMAPRINRSDRFSACSIEQMQPEISSAACLTPANAVDIAVSTAQTTRDALAGVAFTQVFTVTNFGFDPATNASVTVTVDPELALLDASTSVGTCTVAAETAICPLGTIGGGAARTVTLSLSASDIGTFAMTAAATASLDADASDNEVTARVIVAPLVDLVVSAEAASVALNEQTTIGATVENVSDFDASMQFTATLSAGIRADQANLGGTACAVAAQTVTCPLTDLAARSSLIMTVALTGVTAGDQEVTLLATSEQAEKTLPDNQLSVRVTVASPVTANAGGGGGGGGAFGSIWLVLLAAAAARQRKAR